MVVDILKRVNWVDILLLALLIRIFYKAAQEGIIVEIFKCLAMAVALFLAFHYYVIFAHYVTRRVNGPEDMIFTLSFAFFAIWFFVFFIFKYIRQGILIFCSIQIKSSFDKWGAVILGGIRFLVTASMLAFVFLASGLRYLEVKTVDSVSGKYVIPVAPGIYQKMCDGFVSRLVPTEKYNQAVRETVNEASKE